MRLTAVEKIEDFEGNDIEPNQNFDVENPATARQFIEDGRATAYGAQPVVVAKAEPGKVPVSVKTLPVPATTKSLAAEPAAPVANPVVPPIPPSVVK